jgi:phosphatidylglycerol lysyltransferase
MNRKIAEILGSLIGLVLFCAALWVLHHVLQNHHYHEIVAELRAIPFHRLALALMFTLFSYGALSCYDMLALRYIKHAIAYPRVAFTSFITYAVGHNLGFSLFTGGSIRYRLYTAWGLSTLEITSLITFGVITFWLGYLSAGATVFILRPLSIPTQITLPFGTTLPIGILFLLVLAAYFAWDVFIRKDIKIRGWHFAPPPIGITLSQVLIGFFDWVVASAALFILLPAATGLSYDRVLGIFLLSQIAGLASNVPGGLGVFESVFLLLAGPVASPPAVVGALLAFRIIYYLIPLSIAAISLASYEFVRRREQLKRLAKGVGRWVPIFAPQILSFTTFLSGVVLLFSGATPAVPERMIWLQKFFPLPVIEISHFLGSILGLGLILLARGLQRRVDAAYVFSGALLIGGIIVSLLKGFDYEEAIILSIMLLALLPSRQYFYRKSSLLGRTFSPVWIAAVMVVIISSLWLALFSYKHLNFSHQLWWQFSFEGGDAPRSLRAMAGVVALALAIAFARLLRPSAKSPGLPSREDLERVTPLIRQSPETMSHLALLGDKALLASRSGRAFIMYAVAGRSWVGLGDPVGAEYEWKELVWQFHEMCDRHGGWTVFYQVGDNHLPLYLDLGLSLLKLGEEARIEMANFSLEGSANKPMRHWHRKPESEGCTFEVVHPSDVPPLLPRVKIISDTWLGFKNTREKGFSLGFFKEDYLARLPLAVVRQKGEIVAFANLWAGECREEFSIDLMRHMPEAPAGVMDYLIIELMLWGKSQGYQWFNLGMAPLSGLDSRSVAPFWNQLGTFLFRHGEHFYNFQGLRNYKDKFKPKWEPRYLVSPGGAAVFRILANVAARISGGLTGVVTK